MVAESPELVRLIVVSPKRCVVVVAPLESRLMVPLPKRLVVTEAESPNFKAIAIGEESDITLRAVVSYIIHKASS